MRPQVAAPKYFPGEAKRRNFPFIFRFGFKSQARLAQSVERKALNLVVVGSSPTVGVYFVSVAFFL